MHDFFKDLLDGLTTWAMNRWMSRAKPIGDSRDAQKDKEIAAETNFPVQKKEPIQSPVPTAPSGRGSS